MVWRNIKPNHSTSIPRYIVALDTETHKEEIHDQPGHYNNYLRCGVAIALRLTSRGVEARKVLHFSDIRAFWLWLEAVMPKRATTWIVAHKASFDWQVVGGWDALDKGLIALDMPRAKRPAIDEQDTDQRLRRGLCVIDDPPFILGLRNANGSRFVVVDTLNWFRCPLAQLGKDIGLPKMEMPATNATAGEWQAYCQRDTEIVERAFVSLVNFVRDNDYGMFRYTAPSQAMSAFRHKHMKHKIVKHDDDTAKSFERGAYYGGETRLLYQGEVRERVYQLDVNSLYPFVMLDGRFPCRLRDIDTCDIGIDDAYIRKDGCNIAEVTLNSQLETYPIRRDGVTAYVRGRFKTVLCGEELRRAQTEKHIEAYHAFISYDMAPLFHEYIVDLFTKRQKYKRENNLAYDALCKLLLNSLYGKFGQRSYKWEQVLDRIPDEPWSKWVEWNVDQNKIELWRSIGEYVFHSPAPGEHNDSFPAIPAFVCSAAREYMRYLRRIAGFRNVFYQATDSLFVTQEGYWNLLSGGFLSDGGLGKLRVVATSDKAEFIGANNYSIGNRKVRAGLGRTARQISDKKWLVEHFERADGAVARQPTNCVHSWQSVFAERTPQIAGIRCHDGWITPLTLDIVDPVAAVNEELSSLRVFATD